MDLRSRILFISLVAAIAASVSSTYWVTMHEKDIVIINDLEEGEVSTDQEEEPEL